MPPKFQMKIEKVIQQTEDSKSFILVPTSPSDGLFDYIPGQFFILEAEITRPKNLVYDRSKLAMVGSDEKVNVTDRKAFSIVSSPTEEGHIELLVKSEKGVFAPYFLQQAKVGDICTLHGPQGNFMKGIFKNDEKFIACWSAGSGIPSTISLMKFVIDKSLDTKIMVFDSNKTANDIIYHERIKALVGQSDSFSAVFVSTREENLIVSDNPRIFYSSGRFWNNENTLKKYAGDDWQNYFNTICGSSSFINGRTRDEKGMLTKFGKGIEDNLLDVGIQQSKIEKDQFYLQ